jgi:hypothetical protein
MKRIHLAQNRVNRLANVEIGAYGAIRQWKCSEYERLPAFQK